LTLGRLRAQSRINNKQERAAAELMDRMGVPYERQVAVGKYVVDFMLTDRPVAVEVQDDYWHAQRVERSEIRQAYIESQGIRVVWLITSQKHLWQMTLTDALLLSR
jgi:very-short-patch-repair endonuclease